MKFCKKADPDYKTFRGAKLWKSQPNKKLKRKKQESMAVE